MMSRRDDTGTVAADATPPPREPGAAHAPADAPRRVAVVADLRGASPYLADVLAAFDADASIEAVLVEVGGRLATPDPDPPALRFATTLAAWVASLEHRALRLAGRFSADLARRAATLRSGRFVPAGRASRHARADDPDAAGALLRTVDVAIVFDPRLAATLREFARAIELIVVEIGSGPCGRPELIGLAEVRRRLDRTPVRLTRYRPSERAPVRVVACQNRTRALLSVNAAAAWGRAVSLLLTEVRAGARVAGADTGRAEPAGAAAEPPPVATPARCVAALAAYPLVAAANALGGAGARRRRWQVAIADESRAAGPAGPAFEMLHAEPGTWAADPMLFWPAGEAGPCCFVEEFDTAAGRGRIAVHERDGRGWRRRGVAIDEPFHLSFPFVFEHDGRIYMCPDASAARRIVLYRCTRWPIEWVQERVLMDDVCAADTVLFPHAGRWWMLTCIDRSPGPDNQSELHAFWADSPLASDWRPVAGNPVHADCHGARNGGLLRDGDELVRVGQQQSFSMYGHAIRLYRIRELSPDGYREELVRELAPPAALGAIGLHTYSRARHLVATDLLMRR